MSNPLLRPSDPRFQKPDIRDPQGQNRFAEGPSQQNPADAGQDLFAAAASDEPRPFVPKYQVQQRSRPTILFILAGVGWGAAVVGAVSLAGLFDFGWLSPLLGVVPAGAAWLLAYEELKAIDAGVIAVEAREKSRHAYWLGLMGLILCLAVVAAMIYRGLHFLPNV